MLCRELGFQITIETYVFTPGGACQIAKLRKLNKSALSPPRVLHKNRAKPLKC